MDLIITPEEYELALEWAALCEKYYTATTTKDEAATIGYRNEMNAAWDLIAESAGSQWAAEVIVRRANREYMASKHAA